MSSHAKKLRVKLELFMNLKRRSQLIIRLKVIEYKEDSFKYLSFQTSLSQIFPLTLPQT